MSNIKIIEQPEDIDLNRHGAIEAHAGTGKTHTIVEMVLNILEKTVTDDKNQGRYIHIREVLLVTFTEKAAGELKKRIREGLEKRLRHYQNDNDAAKAYLIRHLEDCLNNLHESFIGTIHGVCLRLLQTWPFETGVHFKTEMVDDAEGLAEALRESMRTHWQDSDTCIPWALSQLQEQGARLTEKHVTLARDTAGKLLDKDNTLLDRRTTGGRCLNDLRRELETIQNSLDDPESAAEFRSTIESLIAALSKVSHSNALEPERLELLDSRVLELQEMCRLNEYDTKILSAPCKAGRTGIYTKGHFKKAPELADIEQLCTVISGHPCLAQLKQKDGLFNLLPLTLICDAAELLRDLWVRAKQEKGLISFQDMLRLMHEAVTGNPEFCARLRHRLRYGIIDEFQDTSVLQWWIFEKVFLETSGGNEPRLFIVGDPKQSIYAFQGADVQSYLDAKSAIEGKKGQVYGLINNYRSLPETIDGYNTILRRGQDGKDWFAFDDAASGEHKISYPSEGEGGELAKAPATRKGKPSHALPGRPVHIMMLGGKAPQRRTDMARQASRVIRSLRGKTISVPHGTEWDNVTLDYKDFAVIVEAHHLAGCFLDQFQADGIPAVKYKMEGVFQSPMARDMHALLRAILHSAGDPAPRLAALLTRFFNYHPAGIDPEKDLEPCRNPYAGCKQGNSCISHALEDWTLLASKQLWSQLFKSILERTNIRERLIRLADGQRHLADLRQVSEYCIEKLYRGNLGLELLVEHLGLLLAEEASVGQDKNLFMLSTDKSSVRVLTMHAAKGLEFPVVFVATTGSREVYKGPDVLSWIGDDHRSHIVPYLKSEETKIAADGQTTPHDMMLKQANRERRRLLYVALTRAQAMLFVPAHCKEVTRAGNGGIAGYEFLDNNQKPDKDLAPRLLRLFDNKDAGAKNIELFNEDSWKIQTSETAKDSVDHLDPTWKLSDEASAASVEMEKQIQSLHLHDRICRQTSYSELSREADSDRAIDHSEEGNEDSGGKNKKDLALPSSAQTGDALHLALEELLGAADIAAFVNNTISVSDIVGKYLVRNGVLKGLSGAAQQAKALSYGVGYVKGALTTPLTLPQGGTVTISDLKPPDRIPEMEFLLGVSPHWVHGYMDLVFRLENKNAEHPWQYFVLDWKSDRIDAFDEQSVAARIHERHYDLQAKIYCHALDKYLKGVLGDGYDPKQNLGGAVYVFLRSFDNEPLVNNCHVWTRPADPKEDAKHTIDRINNLIGKNAP